MAANPTSPIAPAKVLVLLLPVGRIKTVRFTGFVDRLLAHTSVRLGDVTPDSNSASFSPLAFPNGIILYNLTTSLPPQSHAALSPFETFREPLIVIGISDASEYEESGASASDIIYDISNLVAEIRDGLDRSRDQCPRALVTRSLLFDFSGFEGLLTLIPNVMIVNTPERPTTLKTIMADISSLFLAELSTLARTIQTAPPLDLLYNAAHGLSTTVFPVSERAAVPFRSSSLRTELIRTNSPATSSENGEEHSHDRSLTNSPALSTMVDFQKIRSVSTNNATDASALSGVANPSELEGAEDHPINSDEPQISPKIAEFQVNLEQKKKNRNSSGGISDFAASRLKARQAVIIGSLYLHAGRWVDAMRELVDGATRAKAYNDHLWHSKALENLLATMLVLAWAGFEFQVPQICWTVPNRSVSTKRNSSITSVSFGDIRPSNDPSHSDALHNLCLAIPDLVQMIISTYARAANSNGELPFQFAFSESVIRLGRLIAALHLDQNLLKRDSLDNFVLDTPLSKDQRAVAISDAGFKARLSTLLQKGYPTKSSTLGLSVHDSVMILAGISSVFSLVDMKRNQAMTNKQLLAVLSLVLDNVRKMQCNGDENRSELNGGVASENIYTGPTERSDLEGLQRLLCQEYGIFNHNVYAPTSSTSVQSMVTDAGYQIPGHIINDFIWRSLGSRDVKKDVLRLCANVSELSGDYQAAMDYLAALFCTLRPSINSFTGSISVRYRTSREEQLDFASQMSRVLDAAVRSGTGTPATAYWDPFLVCSIEVQEAKLSERLFLHSVPKHLPESCTGQESGPFLHDAYSKLPKDKVQNRTLIAGEAVEFVVMLRNLYEFEIRIDSLTLLTEVVKVEQTPIAMTLGPFRKQRVLFSGVPLSSGEMSIHGCKIQVRGCREQDFLVFPTPWDPSMEIKTKNSGLCIPSSATDDRPSVGSVPQPKNTVCSVSQHQPFLKINSTSLAQSTISILQGQTHSFTITVQNISRNIPVNFLHLSFQCLKSPTSTSDQHKSSEVTNSPFSWRRSNPSTPTCILAGQCCVLDVEVYGIPALSQCTVVIDYAHLNQPVGDTSGSVLTRRLSLPLTVTVNPSIDLFQLDVLSFDRSNISRLYPSLKYPLDSKLELKGDPGKEVVLVLLDLRNSWLRPLLVSIRTTAVVDDGSDMGATEVIQPGHISRLMVLIPRILWEELDTSAGTNAADRVPVSGPVARGHVEQNMIRCRDAVVKQLTVSWQELGREDCGVVDISSMDLTTDMIDLVREDAVGVRILLSSKDNDQAYTGMLKKNTFTVHVDEDLMFMLELTNRTRNDLQIHVQLRPGVSANMVDPADDVSNCLAWTGCLRRRFVRLRPGEPNTLVTGLCFFAAGSYEVTVDAVDASHRQEHNVLLGINLPTKRQIVLSTSTINVIER